jgi:hypothetical protein
VSARLWLLERLGAAPPALLQAMLAAFPDSPGPVPEVLAEAAAGLYESVARGPQDRSAALPLLAADALMTHAIQAQAELDPSRLERRLAAWGGGGRIGRIVTEGR